MPGCRYCTRARALLARQGLSYTETDVHDIPGVRSWLVERFGRATVPQIVIDGEPIGGSDDLARLARLGVLDALASGRAFPIMYKSASGRRRRCCDGCSREFEATTTPEPSTTFTYGSTKRDG